MTPDSKKVVDPKKDTVSNNSVAEEKLAIVDNNTAEKKTLDSKEALNIQDSVKPK